MKPFIKLPKQQSGQDVGKSASHTQTRIEVRNRTARQVRLLELVHVEVAFEDALLHGIGHLWLFGHLAGRRLHDGHALGTLVVLLRRLLLDRAVDRMGTGHGGTFGARAHVLGKIVAFACSREHSGQFVFSKCLIGMLLEVLSEKMRKDGRSRSRRIRNGVGRFDRRQQ